MFAILSIASLVACPPPGTPVSEPVADPLPPSWHDTGTAVTGEPTDASLAYNASLDIGAPDTGTALAGDTRAGGTIRR